MRVYIACWLPTCHNLHLKVVCYESKQSIQQKNEIDTQYAVLQSMAHMLLKYFNYGFMTDHQAYSVYSVLAKSVEIRVVIDELVLS